MRYLNVEVRDWERSQLLPPTVKLHCHDFRERVHDRHDRLAMIAKPFRTLPFWQAQQSWAIPSRFKKLTKSRMIYCVWLPEHSRLLVKITFPALNKAVSVFIKLSSAEKNTDPAPLRNEPPSDCNKSRWLDVLSKKGSFLSRKDLCLQKKGFRHSGTFAEGWKPHGKCINYIRFMRPQVTFVSAQNPQQKLHNLTMCQSLRAAGELCSAVTCAQSDDYLRALRLNLATNPSLWRRLFDWSCTGKVWLRKCVCLRVDAVKFAYQYLQWVCFLQTAVSPAIKRLR